MKRREFFGSSLGMVAASALPPQEAVRQFPDVPGLTKYVSEFIVNTKYSDIPDGVLALGRKPFSTASVWLLQVPSHRWGR